ncbi:hypothetical protein SAMN02744783_04756 [Serratia sp. CC22-02]|nr:hypothetical protein [Serratia sp. CC22-02]SMP80931.1 hypothetical protein SAMN02744783_04756 [Serratia sp. CC22-02]
MTQTTERQQFAEQNEMSMEFVNWFFDEKKDDCRCDVGRLEGAD